MNIRKESLVSNEHYHIFSRSIAKYVVFNDELEFRRMYELISIHRFADFDYKYSRFTKFDPRIRHNIAQNLRDKNNLLVDIIAFSIMPTHIHLLLKQMAEDGITKYMGRILNSYSKYFNIKHHRTGPLWASNFKNVLISSDKQLLHLTRYIHLNPVTAGLVKKPSEWKYSSYNEYTTNRNNENNICNYKNLVDVKTKKYIEFVYDQKNYQRELSLIKNLLMDNYTG